MDGRAVDTGNFPSTSADFRTERSISVSCDAYRTEVTFFRDDMMSLKSVKGLLENRVAKFNLSFQECRLTGPGLLLG